MKEEERLDEVQATFDARTKPKDKGAAPHWIRCSWYKGTRRCLLADGHAKAEHEYPKEPD